MITSLPLRIDNQKEYVFSFMAKADRPTTVTAAFPYKGIGTFKLTGTWQRFTSSPVRPNRWYIRPGWNEIRLESPLDGSTIWIDAVMLEAGTRASAFRPSAEYEAGIFFPEPFKLFAQNEKRSVQVMAISNREPLNGTAELRITDLFDRTRFRETRSVSLKAGEAIRWTQDIPTGSCGYFRAELRLLDSKRNEKAKNITTYAILAPPRNLPYEKSWCGILGGIDNSGRRGSTAADLALMGASLDETLDAIRLIGCKWIRIMGIGNWRNTEPVRGTYEWKWDEYLAALKRHRFGILAEFLSHDAQPWSNSGVIVKEKLQGGFHYTARAEDVAKFTADFARRYRGRINSINLMNETNGYPPEEYIKIAKAVYRTFKKEAPEVLVQGPGYPATVLPLLSGKDTTWITRALKLGLNDCNDIMGIHCYSPGHAHSLSSIMRDSVELLLTNQNMTFAEMRRLQVEKFKREYRHNRIWDTESGAIFNTVAEWMNSPAEVRLPWYTEHVAAARMIRWNILRMAMGIERHFHFMFLFASGQTYHTLDLMNIDGTPRAGVAPLSTFYRLFDGSSFVGKVQLDGTTHLYVFRDFDGKAVAACWDPILENRPAGRLHIPRSAGVSEALDFTGNPVKGKNGVYPLSDAPLDLKSDLAPEEFRNELKKSRPLLESFRGALSIAAEPPLRRPGGLDEESLFRRTEKPPFSTERRRLRPGCRGSGFHREKQPSARGGVQAALLSQGCAESRRAGWNDRTGRVLHGLGKGVHSNRTRESDPAFRHSFCLLAAGPPPVCGGNQGSHICPGGRRGGDLPRRRSGGVSGFLSGERSFFSALSGRGDPDFHQSGLSGEAVV